MIDKEMFQEMVKEYLKENLSISVWTEKYYGDYGNRDGFKVSVTVDLDGEQIAESSDYSTL